MIGWVGDDYNPVDHITYTRLSALREVNWDVKTQSLVAKQLQGGPKRRLEEQKKQYVWAGGANGCLKSLLDEVLLLTHPVPPCSSSTS